VADPIDLSTLLASTVVAAVVSSTISIYRERYILNRKAVVDYRSNARIGLYAAVEPLRLELLFAARDLAGRVTSHVRPGGRAATVWNMSVTEYYVQSFVYRFLRPLAVGQLIKRQMSLADFAVDEIGLALLRFDDTAREMLTGGAILADHKGEWGRQTDHLFSDNLQVAAAELLIHSDGKPDRVADFAEFAGRLKTSKITPPLSDLFDIFARCDKSLMENPVFWLRLVGYGYTCNRLLETLGPTVDRPPESWRQRLQRRLGRSRPPADLDGGPFRNRSFDRVGLLKEAADKDIAAHPEKYVATIDAVTAQGL
jgi:hypothetical protein